MCHLDIVVMAEESPVSEYEADLRESPVKMRDQCKDWSMPDLPLMVDIDIILDPQRTIRRVNS
jgi:hypothetical protein